MTSVGEDFPKQQARVRELLKEYQKIPTGAFGEEMMEEALRQAEEAMASGDCVRILQAYERLRGCQ